MSNDLNTTFLPSPSVDSSIIESSSKQLVGDGLSKREKRRIYLREWRSKNKDKESIYNKRSSEYKKNWLLKNSEKRKKAALAWYYRNRPPLKLRELKNTPTAIKCRRLRKTSIQFCIADRLRANLGRALRRNWVRKSLRTMEMVGCSVDDLKLHLESQFKDGMSWDNRSTWHIDHYVPISAFDLTDTEERKWAFNYRNLRPLNKTLNQKKQDKIPSPLPEWLPTHICEKILSR